MKSRLKKYFRAILLSLSLGLIPALSLGAQDPWQLLDNFTSLPSREGSNTHYIHPDDEELKELLTSISFRNYGKL